MPRYDCEIGLDTHQNMISGMHNANFKLQINAPPEKGKANKEIIRFLSREFGLRKSDIEIVSGKTSQDKKIKFFNIEKERLIEKLKKYTVGF